MDPDPYIWAFDLQDANKELLITFDGTFTLFFKDKKS
jgi:hypothetical protein